MNTYPIKPDRPWEEAEKLHQAHRYTGHFARDEKEIERIRNEPPPKDTDNEKYAGWTEWLLSTDREGRTWFRNIRTGVCQKEPPNQALAEVSGQEWPPYDPTPDYEREQEQLRKAKEERDLAKEAAKALGK